MSKVLLVSIVALLGVGLFMTQFGQTEVQSLELANKQNLYLKFQAWKAEHRKFYESAELDAYKFSLYVKNLEHIIAENAKGHDYVLGETIFMDITHDEFVSTYLNPILNENAEVDETMPEINGSFQWTEKEGDVTPVKDQGQCGSCWAFSTTGTVEGYLAINKGEKSVSLSEQQLVDCSTANYGCNGGWPYKALAWIKSHGITTEKAYPYTARDGTCKTESGSYHINGYTRTTGCTTLVKDINTQPTSVCVDASNWSFYRSGTFSNCGTATNHAVLATGYDSNGNWIIKNSWGASWGEKGYITLKSGNTCAVCSQLANAN